ncbi:MAG: NAD(+) synthase [Ruminococcus sp.]|nr:NAD(+) synthase [Ruminococcus sp.]
MKDGFIKVACASPNVHVADCDYNATQIIDMITQAHQKGAKLIAFPELSITSYTCGDLFLQDTLLNSAKKSLIDIVKATESFEIISIVGLPFALNGKLYNCGAVIYKGDILGLVPKSHIPNYSEFYEARLFTSGKDINSYVPIPKELPNDDEEYVNIPFGQKVFKCDDMPEFTFGIEICEDLWVNSTPSERLAEQGATLIVNLSASDEIIGKSDYRRTLIKAKSGALLSAYMYADASIGESTTDMVFAGHNIIAENGSILAESKLFENSITYADIDVLKLTHERRRSTTFDIDNTRHSPTEKSVIRTTYFCMNITDTKLDRHFSKTPFVPSSKDDLSKRCEEILAIQSVGLMTRLKHIGSKTAVIGLSGGLDSTLALIVMVHAFNMLHLDRKGIIAVTMPCFGTTDRTYSNACNLAREYGTTLLEINIKDSVNQHFKDIDHDINIHDVTYENSQARERTQILMDIANQRGGIVIGTGDLSELALGWATYNGDHMSMYAVNASIPKTLVRYLVGYEATVSDNKLLETVLKDVLDTPVSPELLPPTQNGEIAQKTEDLVGPYELHDFFLYYMLRFGFSPTKIFRLAVKSFDGEYSKDTILKWLKKFYYRFFSQQFKRSCLPDAPKVGTVTLSPRGDFRMPSDACVNLWIKQLETIDN